MGNNTANGAGDNEPEDDPKPFAQDRCPLGDGCPSHFLGFYLSDPVIRHAFPASECAAVTLETAGLTGIVSLIPDALCQFTISTELSAGASLATLTIQLVLLSAVRTRLGTVGF